MTSWPVVVLCCAALWCQPSVQSGQPCFCKLSGTIDECECTVDSVNQFNSQFYPLLKNLLERNFFRYYRVNLDKTCPFWDDERECTAGGGQCGIEKCDDEVPDGLKAALKGSFMMGDSESDESCKDGQDTSNTFDPLDQHVSDSAMAAFQRWAAHDDAENKFCEADDEDSTEAHYVDLTRNPERYTGYKGASAAKVWASIYQENCFKPDPKFDKNFLLNPKDSGLCLEKRVFYRLVSGLHTSISVQICANHYKPPKTPLEKGEWFPNVEMFKWRFSEETTKGEGPQRLKNLYFTYLLELRALHKAAPYLKEEMFYTGNAEEDRNTRVLIDNLTKVLDDFPDHFDETKMFTGTDARARLLKEEFRHKFLNISRIMDCVACDKCRLWGKVNTHGMGTALKVLFSAPNAVREGGQKPLRRSFQLTRNEVIALFNSLGRFASSIAELNHLKQLMGHSHGEL